jgi:hypothetical protein
MKAWGSLLCLVCASVATLALPGMAAAKPGYFVSRPGQQSELNLRGTHGYRIQIAQTQPGSLYVIARKRKASVTYFVHSRRSAGEGIVATLPGVGRISARFRPIGRAVERGLPDSCKGRGNLVQHGTFVGAIKIEGEQSYTEVDATHVKGKVTRSFRRVCDDNGGGSFHFPPFRYSILVASSKRGHENIGFFAARSESKKQPALNSVVFSASSTERRGSMLVDRSIFAFGKLETFAVDGLQAASLSPPQPFTGTASFQQISPKAGSWTGSLSAELPGVGPIALAGPEFSSALCNRQRCVGVEDGSGTQIAVARKPRRKLRPAR